MPCDKCGKKNCNGKCGISPSVLQINNNNCTLFHRVDVPASMGDEKVNPPKNGMYKNVLLYYEASGNSYLYSSDGIPTKLTGVVSDYEVLLNKPWINGVELIGHKTLADLGITSAISGAVEAERNARVAADNALSGRITANSNAITAETTARENADNALDTRVSSNSNAIANEVIARENGDDALSARIDDYEDALEGEEAARKAADIALGGRIDANTAAIASEITARQNADTALSNRINTNANNISTNANNIAANTSAITANSNAIAAETTARQNADNALSSRITANSNAIAAETTARQNADNALSGRIDSVVANLSAETTARENADAALDGRLTAVEATAGSAVQPEDIDKVVMTDISASGSASATTINESKVNLKTGVTSSEQTTLPVASSTTTGVMNAATYNAVADNTNNINAILSGAVAISNLPASPSQSALTTAWQNETSLSSLINRASIYDVTNSKVWTYYANDNTWYATTSASTVTINTFTNNSEGTIKGSTADGQVFAENDGTGSVKGWDTLTADVANAKSKLSGIQAGAEVNVQSDWSQSNSSADDFIKNKPTIGNATLTIQKNGSTVNTFTANATSNVTANIAVPTKTSDLENDSGFVVDDGEVVCSETEDGFVQVMNPSSHDVSAPLTHLFGNTTQKTLSGKNLTDLVPMTNGTITGINNSTVETVNDSTLGRQVIHETATGTYPTAKYNLPTRLESGKYYALTLRYKTAYTGTGATDQQKLWVAPAWSGNNWDTLNSWRDGRSKDQNGAEGTFVQPSTSWTVKTFRFYVDPTQYEFASASYTAICLSLGRGLSAQTTSKEAWFADIMLTEITQAEWNATTYSDSDFQQYVGGIPSPNPDFPQAVNTVSGAQTVRITGKNLFDINTLAKGSITVSDGIASGTSANFHNAFGTIDKGIPLPSSQIAIRLSAWTDTATATTSGLNARIFYTDGTVSPYLTWSNDTTTPTEQIIVSNADKTPKAFCLSYSSDGAKTWHIKAFQIEYGSTATAFEPYQGQSQEINLGSLELAKIGTYQDRIYKDEGKWYIEKQVGKVVLDGTEGWVAGTGGTLRLFYSSQYSDILSTNQRQDFLSNNFHFIASGDETGAGFIYQQRFYFYYGDTNTDAPAFKSWLTSHPTTVYYPLATPTDTQITDSELIEQLNHIYSLYQGVNNLFLIPSAGAQGEMELCASFSQLPVATTQRLGAVIPRDGLSVDGEGYLDVVPATVTTIGGVKVGENLSITPDGVLSADAQQIDVDSALSPTSENPVQNKVINTALSGKQDSLSAAQLNAVNSGITLAKVSTYDGYASQIASKPDTSSLATVATSGSYTDLSNKPTIGNATLTIQKNGATINTFTANATSNKTINVTVPTKTSDITNDSNFVVDANYVHTDNNFTSALKTKLDGVAAGAEVNVQSDWNVSDSSSDAYIKNKPTIPAAQVQSNWTQTTTTAVDYIKNKPTLATVATSGSYNDLSNKPTIPTVNNATLTIQKNGSSVGTWTSNASANKTVNITVPTRTSELTNNSGFITSYTETDPVFSASPAATITAQDIEAWTDKSDFSGNYNDLTNKPTIPTVNNATLTIQKNGTNVQTFTANSSSNKVANITVPVITLTNTDPGEGGSLAANNFIGVYI